METILQPNEVINGRYVLKTSKGRGTFGQVWLAHDRATDEDVAIKFYVALDHKGREEFIQEFRIAAKLQHKNLLVTKDYGEWRDQPYLTMKYCDKGSAGDLVGTLQPNINDEKVIWRFIRDVAAGLAYLHAVEPDPIVHQDIKPDNILVDSDGTFLITDFGISKRVRNTMLKQSTRALKAGAPAYMGPERFSNNPEPILASDVWSLGASIYELAEGELPFSGMGGIMMSKGAEIPLLSSGWSKNLNDIMRWCLEKETWNRAKACQVQEIAETVLNAKHIVAVDSIILQMKGNGQTTISHKDKGVKDPRATNPQAGHMNVTIYDENNGDDTYSEQHTESVPLWKKPLIWGIAVIVVLLICIVLWFLSSRENSQIEKSQSTAENVPETVLKPDEKVNEDTLNNEKTPPQKTEDVKSRNKDQVGKTISRPTHETSPQNSVGTLNLGYATWKGSIKGGQPDGKGTMTFTSSHRIDSRDPSGRIAEAGDRIEGTYMKGHLDEGRWHKSDGTTEYIMIGE